jgi:hypothetical protein
LQPSFYKLKKIKIEKIRLLLSVASTGLWLLVEQAPRRLEY